VRGGHLHVVENAAQLGLLEERVKRERAAGMDVRIVDGAEVRDLAPGLMETALAAAYTPGDGQAHPPSTTRAFLTAAQRHGAHCLTGVRVAQLRTEQGRVKGVGTVDGGQYEAQQVVLAAGVWSQRLAATIGLELPVRTRALQMLLTTPAAHQLGPTVTAADRALSAKQLPGGEYFIGGGWPGDVVQGDDGRLGYKLRQASINASWQVASTVLPAVAEQQVARAWCGLEAESQDGVPLIGRAPGLSGLFLALGFSGHGFQIAPAVGRAVADALAGEQVVALKPLDPARLLL
jgi:sarcosine oxidase subunit beta